MPAYDRTAEVGGLLGESGIEDRGDNYPKEAAARATVAALNE